MSKGNARLNSSATDKHGEVPEKWRLPGPATGAVVNHDNLVGGIHPGTVRLLTIGNCNTYAIT